MEVLCFDVASGGVSGARVDENLSAVAHVDAPWNLPTLTPTDLLTTFRRVAEKLDTGDPPAAISIAAFMHGFFVVDAAGDPVSPIYTWMDNADASGLERVRKQLGDSFHERTGCRYHPMFPVFKLAAMNVAPTERVVSPKAWLAWILTGEWMEDYGMASASGLFNLRTGEWDADILRVLSLRKESLPAVSDRGAIVGRFQGTPVINGSGDGFMATLGSGCESPDRVAATLGTTASARKIVPMAVLDEAAGTFCYRANRNSYLLGCASNNGGNVLDWARQRFGPFNGVRAQRDVPIFLPMLYGERSPDWDARLRASWQEVSGATTLDSMKQSVEEGVAFNLAHYVEILEASGAVRQVVLSGNGFLEQGMASILASVVRAEVLEPESFGLATMRGAAINAWRAVGRDPINAMEEVLTESRRVVPLDDRSLQERYARYKELRRRVGV